MNAPWEQCKYHGPAASNVWACPTCLVELRAERDRLRVALAVAVRQNEHDMLMTGEELRACRVALLNGLPTIGADAAAKGRE
jgi:hypothetical protein